MILSKNYDAVFSDRIKKILCNPDCKEARDFIYFAVGSFISRDWGTVEQSRKESNDEALISGGQLEGRYESAHYGTITITTNSDRTILVASFLDENEDVD